MKRLIFVTALSLLFVSTSPVALAQHSREHRAAVRLCKQKYRDAVRGLKRLRGHDRRARTAQARRERDECIAMAPR